MTNTYWKLWRLFLLATGIFILIGGPMHPGGDMAEMLSHPDWIPSHVLQFVGYSAFVIALVLLHRSAPQPAGTSRWIRLAIYGGVLQAIEMAVHTAAYVDHANLVAGRATPVLTTHIWLTAISYPLFAASVIGLIIATSRERTLASRWVGWIGIIGVAGHGAAGLFVAGFGLMQFRILFPLAAGFGLWAGLASLWPAKSAVAAPAEAVPAET